MTRLLAAAALCAAACTVALPKSGAFRGLPASGAAIDPSAPRYTTEDERLVSAIAGSILNIAAFADRFEAGDAFQVRNVATSGTVSRFTLARRAEVFTVVVRDHVWSPRSYGRLARSFMADGAGFALSEDPAADRESAADLLAADREAVRRENLRLSRLLQAHPRSAALHERAALLLGTAVRHGLASGRDVRPLLCRMTAHLAVAHALHDEAASADGDLAERLLADLAGGRPGVRAPASDPAWADGPVVFGERPQVSILPPV